jgi:hypothetical protein
MSISHIRGTAIADITAINGIAKAGLSHYNGQELPGGGGGGITRVGAGSQVAEGVCNGAASGAVAFPGNVVSGNMLIVGGSMFSQGVSTITDSVGTTYTVYQSIPGGISSFIAWGVAAGSGANTVTVNAAAGGSYGYFSVDEWSGLTQLDVAGAANSGTGTSATAPLTTVAADTLIIAALSKSNSDSITPEGTWTEIGEEESAALVWPYSFIFKVAGSAGLHTPEWTIGGSVAWSARAISLKA